ncbi:MAG: ABC transporter permease [Actinomycetota bacterium]
MTATPARPAAAGAIRRHRPLFVSLLKREVRQRYKGSALGLLWTFIAPLSVMLAYALVFHYVYRVVDIPDYPLFLLSGMVTWFLFAGGAQGAAQSLVGNANLIKKVRFPRELIPASVVGSHLVTAVAMLAVLVPVNLAVVPAARSATLVLLPVALLLITALTVGFALIVAALNVYFRDVEHILGALLLPWFFLTPIFYTPDSLPGGAQSFQWLADVLNWGNVVAPFVVVTRDAIFHGEWPSAGQLGYCVAAAAGMLAIGLAVFRRLEREMAVEL